MANLTKEEIKKKVEKETKKFMKSVRTFLATKAGGVVPTEWECSIMLMESYYKQFMELDLMIQQMDSIIVEGRYGPQVSPLCQARDKASTRLEVQLKEMGITMKSAIKLNVVDAKKEESVLEKFLGKKIEKR